ncbi:hypothetical protein ACF1FX_34600 [Streptomyces sp. NPDC014646]|uniref:hypothetical protein n=1 Tax=Streptomyces sp. NPDC014646 TaxID=3364877 RepID=UPI0036F93175
MPPEDFSNSVFEIALEAADEVVLRRGVVHTQGLQPEDLGVLSALLLRDPARPATLGALRADLRALGWKMGKDRFNGIIGRLKRVGHVAHIPAYDEATQRPTWVTRVYRNPSNNQHYVDLGVSASPQVSSEMRETRNPASDGAAERRETRVSPGQSRNAGNPQSGAESRETRNPADVVSAGQSRNAGNPRFGSSPPQTPPGGLVNPPTVPPRSTTPESVVAAGAGGNTMRVAQNYNPATAEIAVTDAEIEAAGVFLANLPGRWACGAEDIAKYARMLAEAAKRWGWPLGEELEARLTDVTGSSQKIRGHYPRVIPARLKRLPLYAAFKRGEADAPAQDQRGPIEGACPNHPHRTAAECLPCQADPDEKEPAQRPVREVPDDAIAAAKAMVRSGKYSGQRREKTPRNEARARRQSVIARSAEAEAEAEENRLKAAALLQQEAVGELGLGAIPDQAAPAAAPRQQ